MKLSIHLWCLHSTCFCTNQSFRNLCLNLSPCFLSFDLPNLITGPTHYSCAERYSPCSIRTFAYTKWQIDWTSQAALNIFTFRTFALYQDEIVYHNYKYMNASEKVKIQIVYLSHQPADHIFSSHPPSLYTHLHFLILGTYYTPSSRLTSINHCSQSHPSPRNP